MEKDPGGGIFKTGERVQEVGMWEPLRESSRAREGSLTLVLVPGVD
jgi:hypothetical protein